MGWRFNQLPSVLYSYWNDDGDVNIVFRSINSNGDGDGDCDW